MYLVRRFLFVILLGCFFLLESHAQEPNISAEAFGSLPEMSQIKLSPDGSKLASFRNMNGSRVLVVQTVSSQGTNEAYALPFEGGEYRFFQWMSNDRLVFSIRVAGRRYKVDTVETRLYSTDWRLKNPFNLVQAGHASILNAQIQDTVLSYMEEDPDHILLEIDPIRSRRKVEVYKINVVTGQKTRVQRSNSDVYSWYADRTGDTRFGLYSRGEKNKWLYRMPGEKKWLTIRQWKDSEIIDVNGDIAAELEEGKTRQLYFKSYSTNPDIIYVSRRDEGGRKGYYEYDIKKQKISSTIAANEKVDITNLIFDKQGNLLGYTYFDEKAHIIWQDKMMSNLYRMLKRNFPNDIVWVESMTDDKKRFVIKTTSPTNPGDYYLFDVKTMELSYLFDPYPSINREKLSNMHFISYEARDGLKIPAYISLPKGVNIDEAKNLPTIILPHGGPQARDNWGFEPWVQFLTTRGYAVLQMNYRGSTGYGEGYRKKGYQQWGKAMLDDIIDGTNWMIDQGMADPKRICIMGWSYGGYAALQAPIRQQGIFKCAIAGAAVTDMRFFMRKQSDYIGYSSYYKYIKDEDTSLSKISPYQNRRKLNHPILLVHGTKDRRVPYAQSSRLAKAMKKKAIRFVSVKGGDHFLSRETFRIKFLQEVEKFLEKNL